MKEAGKLRKQMMWNEPWGGGESRCRGAQGCEREMSKRSWDVREQEEEEERESSNVREPMWRRSVDDGEKMRI